MVVLVEDMVVFRVVVLMLVVIDVVFFVTRG